MTEITLREIVTSVSFLGGFLLLAGLFNWVLMRVARRMVEKTATVLDDLVLDSLRRPIFIGLILGGLYLAVVSLPLTVRVEDWVVKGGTAVFAALGIYTALAAIDGVLRWYALEVAPKIETKLDERLVAVLRWGVPLVAGILGLFLVLDIMGVDLPPVRGWLAQHGGRLALIVVLSVAATFGVSQAGPRTIRAIVARRGREEPEEEVRKRAETLAGVLVATAQVVIIAVTSFMLLSEMGLNITPILTGVGVAGIAIGFGAQSLVKDFIAGLFIVVENQYRIGDVVKIADIVGLVENINLRRTVLRDLDGIVHMVPNGEIKVASNFTREWSRVNINISVAYGEDLDRVMEVINKVGKELAEDPAWAPSLLTPPQALRVDKLGDSGIEIKILGDTKPLQQWSVMGELRLRIKKAFDAEGIEIPWPHTKVYFGNTPFPSPSAPDEAQRGAS